jgi:hypothetical protein
VCLDKTTRAAKSAARRPLRRQISSSNRTGFLDSQAREIAEFNDLGSGRIVDVIVVGTHEGGRVVIWV